MAYSMNWRPDQDTASVEENNNAPAPAPSCGTGSPRPMGPIPGILPPGRQAGQTNSFPPSTTKFSSSYSMNWKPPEMDVEPAQGPQASALDQTRPTIVEGQDVSTFRALLTPCPSVKLFNGGAASCEVDGMICMMERDAPAVADRAAPWTLRFYPSRQALTFSQSLSLSRAAVNCLYAILCRQEPVRTLSLDPPARNEVHRDVYQVIQRLGLGSRLIEPPTVLRLHAYLDTAFLAPPNPSLSDKWSCLESPRICFGTSMDTIYTRYSAALAAYVQFEPIEIEKSEGVRLSCRKDAMSQAHYSVDVLIQNSKAIDNLSLDDDGDIHAEDLCLTILTPSTPSVVFPEACFIALCHFVLLDDPRRNQIFFATWDRHLEEMLHRYGARLARYLAAKDIPSTKPKTPIVYRLKAATFWDKVKIL